MLPAPCFPASTAEGEEGSIEFSGSAVGGGVLLPVLVVDGLSSLDFFFSFICSGLLPSTILASEDGRSNLEIIFCRIGLINGPTPGIFPTVFITKAINAAPTNLNGMVRRLINILIVLPIYPPTPEILESASRGSTFTPFLLTTPPSRNWGVPSLPLSPPPNMPLNIFPMAPIGFNTAPAAPLIKFPVFCNGFSCFCGCGDSEEACSTVSSFFSSPIPKKPLIALPIKSAAPLTKPNVIKSITDLMTLIAISVIAFGISNRSLINSRGLVNHLRENIFTIASITSPNILN